jgi:hypothetical protein
VFGQVTFQVETSSTGIPGWFWPVYGIVMIILLAAMWKVFTKAGKPGWASLIPIYNVIVVLEIVGRPWWWLLLMFVPFVNLVIAIIVLIDLSKSFGHGGGFAAGLIFLPFIFYLILGFGSSTYRGPAGASSAGMPPAPPAPPQPAG